METRNGRCLHSFSSDASISSGMTSAESGSVSTCGSTSLSFSGSCGGSCLDSSSFFSKEVLSSPNCFNRSSFCSSWVVRCWFSSRNCANSSCSAYRVCWERVFSWNRASRSCFTASYSGFGTYADRSGRDGGIPHSCWPILYSYSRFRSSASIRSFRSCSSSRRLFIKSSCCCPS